MTDFSQSGEQKIVADFFGDRVLRFLDIGAGDGEQFSNTRALALSGWGGLLVEPAPDRFAKLARLYHDRENIKCVEAGLGVDSRMARLHWHPSCNTSSFLQAYSDRWTDRQKRIAYVRVVTLQEVYGVGLCPNNEFAFVSIDAEGMSNELARAYIWPGGIMPSMLCYEPDAENYAETVEHLQAREYKLHAKTANNEIWVRS